MDVMWCHEGREMVTVKWVISKGTACFVVVQFSVMVKELTRLLFCFWRSHCFTALLRMSPSPPAVVCYIPANWLVTPLPIGWLHPCQLVDYPPANWLVTPQPFGWLHPCRLVGYIPASPSSPVSFVHWQKTGSSVDIPGCILTHCSRDVMGVGLHAVSAWRVNEPLSEDRLSVWRPLLGVCFYYGFYCVSFFVRRVMQESQIKRKPHFWSKVNPLMQLLKPPQIPDRVTGCVLIIGFKQSLSVAQSLPLWRWGAKSVVRTYQLWQLGQTRVGDIEWGQW